MVPEGWTTTSVGSAVHVGRGFAFKSEQYRDAGHPILRVSNISEDGAISKQDDWRYIDPSEVSDFARYALKDLDILIVMVGATTGKLGFVSKKDLPALLNQNMWSLRAKESKGLSQQYFRYIARGVVDRFLSTMQGSARGFLRQSDFSKQTFTVPPLPEQRKIADILSTWDAAIEKTEALLATAKAQKRALMQSLLTGKRRFPEFEGQPWKEVRLGDVITDVKRPLQWSDDALYRLISVRRRSGGLFHREDLHGRDIKTKTLKNAQAGDFLISKMQVVHGAMGLVTDEFDGMQISGSYISVVAKDPNQLRIEFFDWLSRMPEMYHRAYLCSYGVHIEKMTFSFGLFLKEKIVIPPSAAEQDRIVKALNCAQNEERELVDAITKLRTEKKALMQQLLTGKRRVMV